MNKNDGNKIPMTPESLAARLREVADSAEEDGARLPLLATDLRTIANEADDAESRDRGKIAAQLAASPDGLSGLLRYMLLHGKYLACEDVRRSDLAAFNGDRALWSMPSTVTDKILEPIRFVERHQTDVLITINSIKSGILDAEPCGVRLFGYRRDGCDCVSFVESQFKDWYSWHKYDMMEAYYRKIYMCAWYTVENDMFEFKNGDIRVLLLDVGNAHPYDDPFKADEEAKKAAAAAGDA